MFFLRHSGPSPFSGNSFGTSLVTYGLLFLLFGISILLAPDLLAYIVASFLILIGASLLIAGLKMRRLR